MQLAARVDACLQTFQVLHIVAADEDIHVLSDLALFVQHSIAKRRMNLPKRFKSAGNISKIAVQRYLQLAVRKRFQMSAQKNC